MKPETKLFGPFLLAIILGGLLSWMGYDYAAIGAFVVGVIYFAGVSLYVWGEKRK